MTIFKVGDRVRRIKKRNNPHEIGYVGVVTKVISLSEVRVDNVYHFTKYLELVQPSWDTLKPGDVLIDKEDPDAERTVLTVIEGKLVAYSSYRGTGVFWLQLDRVKQKYDLKGSEDENVTEVTLEEIAKKFKIPTDKLRIKENN